MNETTETIHPVWCDPAECAFGEGKSGGHLSAPKRLVLVPTNTETAVRITQYDGVDGYPLSGMPGVELTISIPVDDPEDIEAGLDEDVVVPLRPEEALAVGHQLIASAQTVLQ